MKDSEVDMDSTQALLDSTLPDLPDTPDLVDSVIQDSEEDEIFFGNTSTKEKKGTFAKCTRRDTICLEDINTKRRRSFNVSGRTKARDCLLSSQPATRARGSSSRSSLYSQENSIMEEEDEDDCVFAVPNIQVEEVTSTVFDECEELELGVGDGNDDKDEVDAEKEERNISLNVTGRRYRNKKYRNNLESIVSLPSATKVKEIVEGDISLEEERRSHMDSGLELRDEVSIEKRFENMKESRSTRLHSDQSRSSYSSEDSYAASVAVSACVDDVSEVNEDGDGGDCPGLEESIVSDSYSADMSNGSDMVGDETSENGELYDQPLGAVASNEGFEVQEDVCQESNKLSSVRNEYSIEVSGVEPLSQTEMEDDDVPHDDIAPVQSTFNDETASDVSYANSTVNSGVVTFKNTSVSGVYDSFSDDTQDEFLQDTEVQENTDDGGASFVESNETLDDEDKLANVKRNIFEGESDMESFVLGSVASELDFVADAPFTLGSVTSNLDSVSGFVLGSVVSELGSVVEAGQVVQPCGEVSLNEGDDSVFTRNSLGGNSTLSLSFQVPGEDLDNTDTDTVENSSVDGLGDEILDDDPTAEAPHDQSEELEDMEANDIPQILLTRPSISLPSNISRDEERSPSPEFFPASPEVSSRSIYHTAPTSQNATDLSPMFDTTAEEMMLFEMYGESYDEKVEALSKDEKLLLKDRLANRGEEEINMVAEKLHKIMQEKARESSIGSTISPFSLASSTPSFHIPSDPSPLIHPTLVPVTGSPLPPPVHVIPSKLTSPVQSQPEVSEFRVPPLSRNPTEVTYHLPTSASLGKMVTITPSPKKTVSTPWMPPSPSPKYTSVQAVSPARSATSSRPPLSKIPQPVYNTPQRVLQTLNTPQRVTSTTPNSAKKSSRVADMKAAAYAAVASPVAEYVKSNPAPKLVQNVKAKDAQRDLESTLVEVEDKENMEKRLSQLPPCPLPPAMYKAGALAEEQMIDVTGPEYAYIPEAYGTINSSAKVTKHVARVRVGAPQPGLKWNESCLVNDESLNSSPSVAKYKAPVKSVLKQTRRDSGLFDESMLEVSVHETKVVRKMARGRGRGKAKK